MHGTSCALLIVQLGSLMRFDRKRRTSRISQSQGKFFLLTPAIVTLCGLGGDLHPLFNPSILSFSINQLLARLQNSSHCSPLHQQLRKRTVLPQRFQGDPKVDLVSTVWRPAPFKGGAPKSCPSFWFTLGISFEQNSTSRPNGQFLPIAKLMFERSI